MRRALAALAVAAAAALPGAHEAEARTAPLRLRVAVCQLAIADLAVEANLKQAERCIREAAAGGARLAVLPELVDVGYGREVASGPVGAELARPVPGETSAALGALAARHRVWIATALLERAPGGGSFDTTVLIDDTGRVVLRQRKSFVYPAFGGAPVFQGNRLDLETVDSPWGRIGMLNCVEIDNPAWRRWLASHGPDLILVPYATTASLYLDEAATLASETGVPVVGANMVWPERTPRNRGGGSVVAARDGSTPWRAGARPVVRIQEVELRPTPNRAPRVEAGDVATLRLPQRRLALRADVSDDGLPGGAPVLVWSRASGPGPVRFDDPAAATTHAHFERPGFYRLRLTAHDGERTGSGEIAVTLLPEDGEDRHWVGHWRFDGDADDARGGHHGRLLGEGGFAAEAAPGAAPGGSLDLAGAGLVEVPHAPALHAMDGATVALWVKPRSHPGFYPTGNDWASLLVKGRDWWRENYSLGFGAYFYVYARGMELMVPSLDDSMRTPGRWVHLAAVLDPAGGQAKLYVNGVLDHRTVSASTPRPTRDPLTIGGSALGKTSIDGLLDDVRVYTRPLSDAEIAALVPGAVPNARPRVDAGGDRRGRVGVPLRLEGRYRDDGHPATSAIARWTRWRVVRGPGRVDFDDAWSPTATATFSAPGDYVVELLGSDGVHRVRDVLAVRVAPAG